MEVYGNIQGVLLQSRAYLVQDHAMPLTAANATPC
jgi:hypothetical protein